MDKAIPVLDTGLLACPGFRASAYQYSSGLTLVMDSVTKFIQTKTIMDVMKEWFHGEFPKKPSDQDEVKAFFKGQTFVTTYGSRRSYEVHDIIFDECPSSFYFPRTVPEAELRD